MVDFRMTLTLYTVGGGKHPIKNTPIPDSQGVWSRFGDRSYRKRVNLFIEFTINEV